MTSPIPADPSLALDQGAAAGSLVRGLRVPAACLALFAALTCLPGRTAIAPRISSDYCYQLLAADRLYDGLGLTSLQPVAPLQPWEWHYDWGFLSQWPVGYSLAVWACRRLTGLATLPVCQGISVAACTLALVGWFLWVRRMSPRGIAGTLLALVAAGCSVTVGSLINPSTDVIVTAAIPWILYLVNSVRSPVSNGRAGVPAHGCHTDENGCVSSSLDLQHAGHGHVTSWLFLAGLVAGGLFWIRYAAVFVVAGVILHLLSGRWYGKPRRPSEILAFAFGAMVPIAILIVTNRVMANGSVQAQMNLGHTVGFHFTRAMVLTAWLKFTAFGFYDHLRISQWFFCLWPAVVLLVFVFGFRRRLPAGRYAQAETARSGWWLSACVVAGLFVLLIGATSVFGDKFNYVGLERYYQPVKPLYFVLFGSPVLWWIDTRRSSLIHAMLRTRRICQAVSCLVLLVACSWLVRHEWPTTYRRWLADDRERTPSGWWARCFTPGASILYTWLDLHRDDSLVVVSNFHEYLAYETGLPTVPIPRDRHTLDGWVSRISAARGIREPRVIFVLDRDNRWRDYWQPEPSHVVEKFALEQISDCGDLQGGCIYRYDGFVPG